MHAILSAFSLIFLAPVLASPTRRQQTPAAKKIIIDTDLLSFPDDVAALTLANVFQNKHEAEIIGMVSNVNYTLSVPAMDAINTYYGHPDTPFAQNSQVDTDVLEPGANESLTFIQNLTNSFLHDINNRSDPRISSPVDFYTKHLEEAADHSVTIISIGFLTNLAALNKSAGGPELISKKVKELVVQGGHFDPKLTTSKDIGYNLNVDFNAALVLEDWPSNVTYIGSELSPNVNVNSAVLQGAVSSPVKNAYALFRPDGNYANLSSDPLAVYYAVLGLGEYFVHGNMGGIIKITENTTNIQHSTAVIIDEPKPPANRWQYYLTFNSKANLTALGNELTNLLVSPPPPAH